MCLICGFDTRRVTRFGLHFFALREYLCGSLDF